MIQRDDISSAHACWRQLCEVKLASRTLAGRFEHLDWARDVEELHAVIGEDHDVIGPGGHAVDHTRPDSRARRPCGQSGTGEHFSHGMDADFIGRGTPHER